MDLIRRMPLLLAGLLAACALAGCAADNRVSPQAAQPAPAPFARADHLCATLGKGQADVAAIKADLATILSRVDGSLYVADSRGDSYVVEEITGFSESGFQARHVRFDYEELMDRRLVHYENSDWGYSIVINGLMSYRFANKDLARCVAEEFLAIQKDMRTRYVDGNLANFQPFLDQYRAMKAKPQVPEEQRRYIVQANAMAEKKDYAAAIDLYHKALKVDRLSYPAAYYNMALIFSQMGRRQAAILFMKVYLLLLPDAPDARTAQDKIYEWEAFAGVQ